VSATRWLPVGIAAIIAVAAACGDEFETGGGGNGPLPPCNEDPWICPQGQTCWIHSDFTFQCLNSGPGAPGAPCAAIVGTPQCTDLHICLTAADPNDGICTPFCDPFDTNRACVGPATCRAAMFQVPNSEQQIGPIHMCAP
jgi:hypothetical protein